MLGQELQETVDLQAGEFVQTALGPFVCEAYAADCARFLAELRGRIYRRAASHGLEAPSRSRSKQARGPILAQTPRNHGSLARPRAHQLRASRCPRRAVPSGCQRTTDRRLRARKPLQTSGFQLDFSKRATGLEPATLSLEG